MDYSTTTTIPAVTAAPLFLDRASHPIAALIVQNTGAGDARFLVHGVAAPLVGILIPAGASLTLDVGDLTGVCSVFSAAGTSIIATRLV